MKIRHGFHLVASGRAGFGLTHYLDCNVYMLQTGAGYILFDSGAGTDPDAMLGEIRRDGVDPTAITTLFLTHAHADHSGGAEPLRQRLPQLKIAAGPKTAEILGRKDEKLISLDKARGGFYPADYRWTAPVIDHVLAPNETQVLGDVSLIFLETPGHSADHGSYLLQHAAWSALVSGDAVFAGGKVILQDIPDCSVSETIATIKMLGAITFDIFLPGHGAFSLAEGRRHIEAALRFAEMGLPPPNLF